MTETIRLSVETQDLLEEASSLMEEENPEALIKGLARYFIVNERGQRDPDEDVGGAVKDELIARRQAELKETIRDNI